jgi:hypothetical protein
VFPTSVGTELGLARYQSLLGMALVAAITALAMFAQWVFGEPVLPEPLRSWVGRLRRARERANEQALAASPDG